MTESYSPMVRITLLNKNMPVETAHLLDGKNPDTAKAACGNREDFAFCDVGTDDAFTVALETIERDVGCCNIALQRRSGSP